MDSVSLFGYLCYFALLKCFQCHLYSTVNLVNLHDCMTKTTKMRLVMYLFLWRHLTTSANISSQPFPFVQCLWLQYWKNTYCTDITENHTRQSARRKSIGRWKLWRQRTFLFSVERKWSHCVVWSVMFLPPNQWHIHSTRMLPVCAIKFNVVLVCTCLFKTLSTLKHHISAGIYLHTEGSHLIWGRSCLSVR